MESTKQGLDASWERSVGEIPGDEILAGMTELHLCLPASELEGFSIFSILII